MEIPQACLPVCLQEIHTPHAIVHRMRRSASGSIEGFDFRTIDEEFGLRAQGYSSVVMVALGYHSETDFNAQLPKSRLPQEQVLTLL